MMGGRKICSPTQNPAMADNLKTREN